MRNITYLTWERAFVSLPNHLGAPQIVGHAQFTAEASGGMACVKRFWSSGYLGSALGVSFWWFWLSAGAPGWPIYGAARSFLGPYVQGDYMAAAGTLGGDNPLDYDEENLLTSLQVGLALRAAGSFESSQVAFRSSGIAAPVEIRQNRQSRRLARGGVDGRKQRSRAVVSGQHI